MKRVLISLLFATLAGALVFGAAANLPVTAQDLGAGSDTVLSCDETDGVLVGFNWSVDDPTAITSIDVEGIDPACDGLTVYLSILDDSVPAASIYNSNTNYIDATHLGTLTFTPPTALDASQVHEAAVTIAG